jgi:concanavalin A-like lectin/glucanase superfamily protein
MTGSDASVDASDGSPQDAGGKDGTVADGPVISDGGVSGFSCSPAPLNTLLCTTFDTLSASSPDWTSAGWTAAFALDGNNTIDTTKAVTPPQSYLATTLADDAGSSATANADLYYQDISAGLLTTFTLRANVNITSVDTSPVGLMAISYPGDQDAVAASIDALAGTFYLVVAPGMTTPTSFAMGSYTVGTWQLLALSFDVVTSKVTAYINGVQVAVSTAALPMPASAERDVFLGIVNATRGATTKVDFDDVLLTGL